MGIISKSALSNFRNSTRYYSKTINESLQEFKAESRFGKITVFLSHKHDEFEELDSAISFLKKLGIDIYVDWLDDEMPKSTSGVTAKKIKEKIKESRKFIFLATEGAIGSKWCNWELGHGDAQKYISHIAILPVRNNYSNYSGAEYLEIYPYIYESDAYPNSYFVRYPDGTLKDLASWLKL